MAQHPRVKLDESPEALEALSGHLDALEDAPNLETDLQAHAFARQCLGEMEEEDKLNSQENKATDGIQAIVMAPVAGVVSAWQTKGGFPIGGLINFAVGSVATGVSLYQPKSRGTRIAARAGKVLLHSQISIMSRNIAKGDPLL